MTDLNLAVSGHYKKFFEKFSEIDNKPLTEWNKTNVLSYLCRRYKDHYNMEFTFSFKAPPSKSREMFEISKLTQMLSSSPEILKAYIDWVFDSKIIERKKKIASLGYFTHPDLVNEYKFKFLFNKKIDRTTELPEKYALICKEYGFEVASYGELAFINQIPGQGQLLARLNEAGLNISLLDSIK